MDLNFCFVNKEFPHHRMTMFSQATFFPRLPVARFLVARVSSVAVLITLAFAVSVYAQTASSFAAGTHTPNRLTQPIQENSRIALQGTLHPLANKAHDLGAVGDGMKLDRIQVVLKRSDAQESALKQMIGEMHKPGSANYHKWLTPEEFGKQFGPSDADIAKLEGWLGSRGFSITKLNAGRQTLEIAGTAGQFRDTFHTQIHSYQVKGETHFANASAPEFPTAVAPVFGGFVSLNNFHLKSHAKVLGKAQFNAATHETKPEWTIGSGTSYSLPLAPGDFGVQYDLNPLYAAGTKGDGTSIAIVNESNINIAQVNNYRALFGLPVNPPQVIIDGNDPGIDGINSPYGPNSASGEAYLDVELAGAVAPNAQINLVIADSTALGDGLTLAIERAVYSNISPIISLSFGGCEADQGSYNAFISGLWEQAAAQGITVLVSSGDSGSAGCDNDNTQYYAVRGQAVNGLASTPYNVAVGGTDFYYSGGRAQVPTYWNVTPTNSTPTVSLKTKAPEQPWNDSQYGLNLFSVYTNSGDTETSIAGAGGGASTGGLLTGTTYGPYPKPSWQTGTGVPNDSVRDLPDVSLFAANGLNSSFYPICASDGDCEGGSAVQITGIGGTSASTPAFAGIMALVNQKYGRQGQANYVLYPLAAQFPTAFNDVTAGTISVPCALNASGVTPINCQAVSSPLTVDDPTYGTATEGQIGITANTPAYNATTGYDLATGLGTIDAKNLVANWGSVTFAASGTTLTPSLTSFAHGTTVTLSGAVTGTSPTGSVALLTTSTDAGTQNRIQFPLVGGSYSGDVNTLPGGTYDISGRYSGDESNAASTSTPVSITVTPEASKILLQVFSAPNPNSSFGPITSGSNTYTYGIPIVLSAQPTNSAGTVSTIPTGSVVFSDAAATLGTSVVNAEGDAEYNKPLPPGLHSITATYSGDGSYAPSMMSTAVTFAVAKATPVITAINFDTDQNGNNILSANGSIFTVTVENANSFSGLPIASPTGTLTLTGGPSGTTTSAILTPGFDPNNGYPAGIAIFKVPAGASLGSYTFNFSYAGDANYNTTSQAIAETLNAYTNGLVSTTTATASAAATSPAATVQVTVTVTGQTNGGAPTGNVYLISSGDSTYAVGGAALPTSSGTTATVTITVDSASLYQGTNQIVVQYVGDNTYYPSATTVTIANPLSDFSLVPLTTIVSVPGTGTSAGVQTDTINLASYNGFTGAVSLACSAATGVTCSLSQNSVTLASGGTGATTLSVDTSAVTTAGTYSVVVTGSDSTGHLVHTIGFQVVTPIVAVAPGFKLAGTAVSISAPGGSGTSTITATPVGGFTGTVALTCAVTGPAGATDIPTCSAASANVTGATAATATLTFNTLSTTTAGAYTATVTGTSGSTTATTTVGITVIGAVVTPGTFSLTNSGAITVATQGGSGSSTVSVVPNATNPYTGSIGLTCAITTSPAGATDLPTCSLSPASVTLAGSTLTSTLTINTTAQTTSKLDPPLKGYFTAGGGMVLAALCFLGVPVGRRGKQTLRAVQALRVLSIALLFAIIAGAGIGCGGGSSGGGNPTSPVGGTTTGAYTVTVTATPASGTAQTATVALTVN